MVPRIAFVTRELQQLIDRQLKVGVQLNRAPSAAAIPRVRCPWPIVNELDLNRLVRRQTQVGACSDAAFVQRRLEHGAPSIDRYDERTGGGGVSIHETAVAWQQPFQATASVRQLLCI